MEEVTVRYPATGNWNTRQGTQSEGTGIKSEQSQRNNNSGHRQEDLDKGFLTVSNLLRAGVGPRVGCVTV